jgi:hypothetical protein
MHLNRATRQAYGRKNSPKREEFYIFASWRSHLFPCFARVFAWYFNYARRPALIFRSSWASASSDKESYTLKDLRAVPR